MSERSPTALATAGVVAALVLVSAVAVPIASARPAHEIPVTSVDGDLGSADAPGWSQVPAADVALASAPSSVPNADQTSIERVHVQAARGDGRLYVRLQWHDATRDTGASDTRSFTDAAAVQFPVNTSSRPPIAMGGPGNMVNVWYWNGGTGTQELLAGGAGSTTAFGSPAVDADASYGNDTWTVVYSRDLNATGANRTDLATDGNLDVAFAVWNGSNAERAGRKSVSEWHYFPFGDGPQGPPYQTLLWSVAGVAIVLVVGVTAFGIHRAKGGMT